MEGVGVTHLLDTSTWANSVLMPAVLPARIQRLIDHDRLKGLAGVSLLEVAILHRLGRLEFSGMLADFFAVALGRDTTLLQITPAIAAATNGLPPSFHGDPFDRTIVATAKILGLTLITADTGIRDAAACAVEFYPFKPSRQKRSG